MDSGCAFSPVAHPLGAWRWDNGNGGGIMGITSAREPLDGLLGPGTAAEPPVMNSADPTWVQVAFVQLSCPSGTADAAPLHPPNPSALINK